MRSVASKHVIYSIKYIVKFMASAAVQCYKKTILEPIMKPFKATLSVSIAVT